MKRGEIFEAALALLVILLAFALCLAVLSGGRAGDKWAISGPVAHTGFWAYDNVYAPGNGVLYTVDGSSIYAISEDGKVIWELAIPDKYKINGKGELWTGMAAAADGGDIYIIVGPGNEPERGELLAIGPDGTARWIAPLTFKRDEYSRVRPGLHVLDGRIYLYHFHNQIIMDANSSIICNLYDVNNQAGADDAGNMYVFYGNGSLEALDRDGGLLWRHSSGDYNVSISGGWNNAISQPYYHNGTLYVWLANGVMALDTNGNKLWTRTYEGMSTFPDMATPLDSRGNLYLWHIDFLGDAADGTPSGSYLSMILPDGSEVTGIEHPYNTMLGVAGLYDGLYYHIDRKAPDGVNDWLYRDNYYIDPATLEFILKQAGDSWNSSRPLEKLDTYTIQAVDIRTDGLRWNTTLPVFPARTAVVDASNIHSILPPSFDLSYAERENQMKPEDWYRDNRVPGGTEAVGTWVSLDLLPGRNVTYVSLWTLNCEVPTFYGRSKAAYSGGIYALDGNGKILWAKPTGARVTDMKEVNGTIYYGTDDGKLSAANANVAAGAVLSAFFYLFVRFFMAGAVARARSRLDSNDNRNRVLKFIADDPGAGLYDVAKGLGLNTGTVRYHLLILSINRRISSFRADGKHIRYFPSSASFKPDDRSIISLMRRDAMRRTLGALLKNPGLSNRELSRELNMLDSATARYMKELVERGIVENDPGSGSRTSYVIKGEYREKIAILLGRADSAVCATS